MVGTLLEIAAPLLKTLMEKLTSRKRESMHLSPEEIDNLARLLTGRLVYLLRYMDQNDDPIYPKAFGRVLSSFVEVSRTRQPARYSVDAEEAWEKASQYACYYLSALGLVDVYGGVGDEVVISDFGKRLIRSDQIRDQFRSIFSQQLP